MADKMEMMHGNLASILAYIPKEYALVFGMVLAVYLVYKVRKAPKRCINFVH